MAKELTTTDPVRAPKNIYLGLTLSIKGQEVNLKPDTPVNNIALYGLKAHIEEPLQLGKVGEMFDSIMGEFNSSYSWDDLQKSANNIPIGKNIVNLLGSANMAIEELKVDISPRKKLKKDSTTGEEEDIPDSEKVPDKYTVAFSMVWNSDAEGKLFGGISIRGIYLKIDSCANCK